MTKGLNFLLEFMFCDQYGDNPSVRVQKDGDTLLLVGADSAAVLSVASMLKKGVSLRLCQIKQPTSEQLFKVRQQISGLVNNLPSTVPCKLPAHISKVTTDVANVGKAVKPAKSTGASKGVGKAAKPAKSTGASKGVGKAVKPAKSTGASKGVGKAVKPAKSTGASNGTTKKVTGKIKRNSF
jgi:hypothetical protein